MDKKGFLIAEAAVILPVFLIAMLALICIIRVIGVEENVMHIFSEEAAKVAKEAYVTQLEAIPEGIGVQTAEGLIHGATLKLHLRNQIEAEEGQRVSDLQLKRFRYLHSPGRNFGVISGNLAYKTKIPLPIGFQRCLEFEERLVFRGFVGADSNYEAMDYLEMEQEEDSEIVYVFPRAGEKYHKRDCRVIAVDAEEVFLSPALQENYIPCRLCHPEMLSNGSKVYCFKKTGEAYHKGSCYIVERYVVPMEREKAIEKGYAPCIVCGG